MGNNPDELRDSSGKWTSGGGGGASSPPHGGGTHQKTGDKTSDTVLATFDPESRFSKGAGYLGFKTIKEGGNVVGYAAKVEGRTVGNNAGGGREPASWSAFTASGQRLGRGFPRADAAAASLRKNVK